jgi:hypothetical protein
VYNEPHKDPLNQIHPFTRFTLKHIIPQDHMAWETQGPIADRTHERLATTDKGVIMLRELMKNEIAKVQRGEDPIGVYRDANHAMIETNVDEGVRQMRSDARSPSQGSYRNDLAKLYQSGGR